MTDDEIKLKNLQEDYKKAGETWEHLCKEKDEEISILQGKLDAYKMPENEANEIIVELKTENAELKEENEKLKGVDGSVHPDSAYYKITRLEQENAELKAENERLKEKMIRLSEENGNLIIKANTSYNNYRDTQHKLDELCKANIHNLALLSKANKTLQEIKNFLELPEFYLYGKETIHDRILQKITKAEVSE